MIELSKRNKTLLSLSLALIIFTASIVIHVNNNKLNDELDDSDRVKCNLTTSTILIVASSILLIMKLFYVYKVRKEIFG
jgi:uncharacterized membrane protein